MNQKEELVPRLPVNDLCHGWRLNARLKELRRERRLVERAILVLTEIARTRHSRARRGSRV